MIENPIVKASPESPLSYSCKEAIPDAESGKGILLEDSINYLLERMETLGQEHCKEHCAGCRQDVFDKAEKSSRVRFMYIKKTLHEAFRNLPIQAYHTISSPANRRCPACIIVEALELFITIARYSKNRPFGLDTFPCYETSDYDGYEAVIGMEALKYFDITNPAIRGMPPEIKRDVRGTVLPAKEIINRICDLRDGKCEKLSADDLWVLLDRESEIAALLHRPSFEWIEWAQSGLLKNGYSTHGEHMSVALSIALNCYSAVASQNSTVISYESLRQLYTAAYYLSSGETINDRQFNDIFREINHNFIELTDENFGVKYYEQTILGKTIARKYLGLPPPFFCDVPQATPSSVVIPSLTMGEPIIATQATTVNDFDFTADLAQNNQNNQSVVVERADKNETVSKSAVENNVLKLEANPTINVAGQGDVVRETRETVFQTLDWVEEKLGVPLGISRGCDGKPSDTGNRKGDNGYSEKADAAIWDEWEQAKVAKIPKAKFAKDKSMTENEVQNALDRHRKRLGR